MKSRRTAELDPESTVSLVYSCGSRLPSLRAVSPGWRAAQGPRRGVLPWSHPTCFLSWTPAVLGVISTQVFIELY